MLEHYPKISFLISTKNRCEDLLFTIGKIKNYLNENVTCIVFDDGSTDDTSEKVQLHFPEVRLHHNKYSKGYIYCRNKMLNETMADFAISLDDDAHFITENPFKIIENHFNANPICGLIATRIFWGKEIITYSQTSTNQQIVKSYVGCGHVWRMEAWRDIPNYPEWFEFYGEENFASLQLFKKKWQVQYVPELLVQHRVDMKERAKSVKNSAFRYRRSIRADWFNYFMFFPISKIPRKLGYSIWMQCKNKIFKGNLKIILPLLLAILDLILSLPKLMVNRNPLTSEEYNNYLKLNEAKIFWKPEN
jgi:glycosyltransferase involved in cell wall biosynthesis